MQKYTFTPFKGGCNDWFSFWGQYVVEIDSSKISEIGKFNYLLELVQGETRFNLPAKPENSKGKLKNHVPHQETSSEKRRQRQRNYPKM